MTIPVDRREIRFERDDEALDEVEALQPEWLALELKLARLFARIDRKAAYLPKTAASVEEFASRKGYDGFRVRDLMYVGYALDGVPGLEDALRNREVTFAAACEVGRLMRFQAASPRAEEAAPCGCGRPHEAAAPSAGLPCRCAATGEEDNWLKVARFARLRDLRHRVRKRIESVRQGRKATKHFSAVISAETAEDLERCRELATRKAKQSLTKGQMLVVLSTSYLDLHDPLAKEPRKRRMRPTLERPYDRSVPAEVRRAIEERSGGLCEFGCCERPSTELCHIVPHRNGSPREVEDLVQGCRAHHKAYDAKLFRFLGWTEDRLPTFIVEQSNEVLMPKPRPEARDPANRPDWLVKAIGRRSRKPRKRAPGAQAAATRHRYAPRRLPTRDGSQFAHCTLLPPATRRRLGRG